MTCTDTTEADVAPWTPDDSAAARAEGWDIVYEDPGDQSTATLEAIGSDGEPDGWGITSSELVGVLAKALQGSSLHHHALDYLAEFAPGQLEDLIAASFAEAASTQRSAIASAIVTALAPLGAEAVVEDCDDEPVANVRPGPPTWGRHIDVYVRIDTP